jgi:hypothetical protein
LSKNGLKLDYNVNIVCRTLKTPETTTKVYVHEFGFSMPVWQLDEEDASVIDAV